MQTTEQERLQLLANYSFHKQLQAFTCKKEINKKMDKLKILKQKKEIWRNVYLVVLFSSENE